MRRLLQNTFIIICIALVSLLACLIIGTTVGNITQSSGADEWPDDGIGFCFVNDSDSDDINYNFFWIDHPMRETYPGPFMIAGGVVFKGEKNCIGPGYSKGLWAITWVYGGKVGWTKFRIAKNDMTVYLHASVVRDEEGSIKEIRVKAPVFMRRL